MTGWKVSADLTIKFSDRKSTEQTFDLLCTFFLYSDIIDAVVGLEKGVGMEITKQMEMVLYHSEQSDVTVNAIIRDETTKFTDKLL